MDRADKVFDVENWCHWCAKITNPVQIIEWKCGNHTYLDIDERERKRKKKRKTDKISNFFCLKTIRRRLRRLFDCIKCILEQFIFLYGDNEKLLNTWNEAYTVQQEGKKQ